MNEQFLHYLWQFQAFDKSDLRTQAGEAINIYKTGLLNTDAGPDFMNARIKIGEIEWVGNVEIHINSSHWNQHQHQYNRAYENVILHVVWENDQAILRHDNSTIPTLELKSITDSGIFKKYLQLIENQSIIPCESQFRGVSALSKIAMLDKVLTKRLQQKAEIAAELLHQNNGDWEETAYQLLARNFGFKLNTEPFLRLAKNVQLKTLQKHRDNLTQIEALLFGQSGLLNDSELDEYVEKLKNEADFLSKKYTINSQLAAHEWKFLRTRPANFPTIRVAQFAKLVYQQHSFFSLFTQTDSVKELKEKLQVNQSDYWTNHHHFNKKSSRILLGLGKDSIENLIINTAIPLLVCYAQSIDNQELIERAIRFLESISAEKNKITDIWEELDMSIKTAYDSQGCIELYNNFCTKKLCLQCNVGIEILKN
jgi:glycerophosphoryl diester phosphodiesterase